MGISVPVFGVISSPIARMHSEITPTEVARSKDSLPLANFMMGFSNIFQSWLNVGPRAKARPQMASMAVSMVSQSYSEVSSNGPRSSSFPKSFWQAWFLVMMAMRFSVTGLRVVGSAIKEGPDVLSVAARFRLISVTMAL